MQLHHHHSSLALRNGSSKAGLRSQRRVVFVRASNGVNEDVLAKLRAAEEEAARLRAQLAIAQEAKGAPSAAAEASGSKPKRIDSTDSRETLFSSTGERTAWLSEADVEFFVGSGVGETSTSASPLDPEAEATVRRRLLIGVGLSVGALALALVPTEALRPKPSKPLYFYVVPLLRIQDLLSECGTIIEDANWSQLRIVLSRIQGPPNNVQQNLQSVISLLEDGGARSRAQTLASDINEYLVDMDYQRYFEAMPTRTISGAQQAEFVKFSTAALKASQAKLSQFLQLVPRDALQQAFDTNSAMLQ